LTIFEYFDSFYATCLCYENLQLPNQISTLNIKGATQQFFFKFRLTKHVDLKKAPFVVSARQLGNTLSYKERDFQNRFIPSDFNLILMRDNGSYVDSTFGNSFVFPLVITKTSHIDAGQYILLVDPVWNQQINDF